MKNCPKCNHLMVGDTCFICKLDSIDTSFDLPDRATLSDIRDTSVKRSWYESKVDITKCRQCNHVLVDGKCIYCETNNMFSNISDDGFTDGKRKLSNSLNRLEKSKLSLEEHRKANNGLEERVKTGKKFYCCRNCATKLRGFNQYLGICSKCKQKHGWYR